jgi:phosphoenolpyruvate-protein kinase (PTS system EI component)
MVVGAGPELLNVEAGSPVVVDGTRGTVYLSPQADRIEAARLELTQRADRRARAIARSMLPSVTSDGHGVQVLANVSGAAEVERALEAGAEGVGLLRTELAFLTSSDWPTEEQHKRALAPVLAALAGRPATVRVLDFGGDKTPPYLTGVAERGIALLLAHPEPFAAQLRAILASAGDAHLRILLPMVDGPEQVTEAREALAEALAASGPPTPPIGAMIETVRGVEFVDAIAAEGDFLSIGTNDLTHSVLRADRFSPQDARAHDPRVLRAIAAIAAAAAQAGVPLEVCGEAASDPVSAPLLVGAGVDELSVGAARVGTLRDWVRALSLAEMSELAAAAQAEQTPAGVEALVDPVRERLVLLERSDASGEVVKGSIGIGSLGAEAQGGPAPGA